MRITHTTAAAPISGAKIFSGDKDSAAEANNIFYGDVTDLPPPNNSTISEAAAVSDEEIMAKRRVEIYNNLIKQKHAECANKARERAAAARRARMQQQEAALQETSNTAAAAEKLPSRCRRKKGWMKRLQIKKDISEYKSMARNERILSRGTIGRILKQLAPIYHDEVRWSRAAVETITEVAEEFLTTYFFYCALMLKYAKKSTLTQEHTANLREFLSHLFEGGAGTNGSGGAFGFMMSSVYDRYPGTHPSQYVTLGEWDT